MLSFIAQLIKEIEAAHCGVAPPPVYEPVYWPGPPPVELGPPPTFPPADANDHCCIQLVGGPGAHHPVE